VFIRLLSDKPKTLKTFDQHERRTHCVYALNALLDAACAHMSEVGGHTQIADLLGIDSHNSATSRIDGN